MSHVLSAEGLPQATPVEAPDEYIPYEHRTTFKCLREAVTALAFSPDGRFLAAADRTSIVIRRLDQDGYPSIAAPFQPDYKSTIVALAWVYFEKHKRYALITGSLDGEVALSHLEFESTVTERTASSFKFASQITAVVAERGVQPASAHSTRVAVACADGTVALFKLKSKGFETASKIEIKLAEDDFVPKSIQFVPAFGQEGQQSPDLLAFGYLRGSIMRVDKEGKCTSNVRGPSIMASIEILPSGVQFVAYTGRKFELVNVLDGKSVQEFNIGHCKTRLPKRASLCQHGSFFVGATDEGHGLVFDVHGGKCVQDLAFPQEQVRFTAACSLPDEHLIALSGGAPGRPSEIALYRALKKRHNDRSNAAKRSFKFALRWFNPWSVVPWVVFLCTVAWRSQAGVEFGDKVRVWLQVLLAFFRGMGRMAESDD